MNNTVHRAFTFSLSLLATVSILVCSLPLTRTALAVEANAGLDESGNWHRPGPGVVFAETNEPGEDIYIVRHQAPSLARYVGDIPGYAATSPIATAADRLDTSSAASQAYLSYLAGLHANLQSAIEARLARNVEVVHRYDAVLNGIAVRLNPPEAQAISTLPGVRSITRDFLRFLETDNGPRWIGADAVWGEEPPTGNAACVGNCGEGVVVGVIDTGINFDHPSFADIGGDGYDHTNPRLRFFGACDPATGAPFCNDKLIGYYDFTGTGPEDDNGHGSHTASTAAGNVLDIELKAPTITVPRAISGVAPHANVISYKGCSGTPVGCVLSALIASINAATLDEVDVINYSIGGSSSNPWADLDAQAFFDAYTAGIFVATSAGNDGPGFGTMGSPADAPWVTSVGASTHDRKLANGIVNMTNADGTAGPADIFGASLTAPLPAARVVYAGDYAAQSNDPANAHLCGSGTGDPATGEGSGGNPFPPGTFNGEIVVCDRGEYGRVHKSENVHEAGAGGYVLVNDEANGDSLVGDAYPLPGVHISYSNGLIVKQWIADNGALNHQGTAEINGSNPSTAPENGDVMASFSSRGANPAAPSLIKPDVTAPGVDILAAWMTAAGTLPGGDPEFNVISGTSMSSPHTAGAGALVRGVHSDWSPDEVKSALMTTAFVSTPGNGGEVHPVFKENGETLADPFDMGAGRIDMHVATQAGFVLDETVANYENANPGIGGDPTTLNIPSLGNDECGTFSIDGSCTWTRTLRGTAGGPVTWSITATGEAGMQITAEPSVFTLDTGDVQVIEFTADVSASPKHQWIFGEVQFTPAAAVPPAHFPVAVVPKPPGGGGAGLELLFHGNGHDLCDDGSTAYTGSGEVDVVSGAGCVPFLSTDPLDDVNPAATWGPLQPALNGPAFDPRWVWTPSADTRLAGPMVLEWWASQVTTDTGLLLDTNFDITVTVDGTPHVVDHRVGHTFQTPGQPQRLRSVVPIPDITATSTVEVMIEPVFIDTGNTVTFYYDSTRPCSVAGSGECDSRVSMPVITGPLAPVANDDFEFIGNGETANFDVLANDFDPEGGPLALQIVTGPSNGTADILTSNVIRYTHDGSNTSSDSIVYRITDNDGLTDDATVTISIAGSCTPAPDYLDDFESGAPGWTVDTAILVNPNPMIPVSSPWQLRTDPFAQSPATTWYTDASASDPVNNSETTKDDRLVSPEILVSGQTTLSFWHAFSTEDGFDGGVLEITTDGGANWQDIETAGGVFTQGGYNSTVGALGSRPGWTGVSPAYPAMNQVSVDLGVFASNSIQLRYRLAQDVLLGVPTGWAIDDVGLDNLYAECDNTRAPNAVDDSDTVAAGGSVTTDVKANDSDPDTPHADLAVDAIVTPPQHGSAMIVGTDSVQYAHNGNTATTDFYEYRVSDPDGNSATAIVTITIDHGDNEPPVAMNDSASVDEGQSVTVDVKANDSDPDHGNNELDVSIETTPMSGSAGVNADGTITYTHNGDEATMDSFEYRVTDPRGAFDVATVSITINQSQAPNAVDDYDTVAAGESVTTDVRANDSDPDTPQSNLAVTEIVSPPMHGTASVSGPGSVTYTHDGQFDITDSYEYRIEDPQGNSDTAWVNIDITQERCRNEDDGDSDDDDFDDDCQRDDEDSDDDNDGQDDDYDNDDDNDGDSDDSDSDDDNDGIDDEFDQEWTKESQTRSSSQAAGNSDDTHTTSTAPGTLALIALVETAAGQSATVEIRNPAGQLVGTAATVAGRAVVTAVPAGGGDYTVKVRNLSSATLSYDLTIIKRVNWP